MSWDGIEKRKLLRVNFNCRIVIYGPEKDTIDTVANNISEGGIGFTLTRKLEISSIVGLEIYGVQEKPIVCKGIVRWVKSIESSHWRGRFLFNTGIQFYQIKDKDLLTVKNLVESIAIEKE